MDAAAKASAAKMRVLFTNVALLGARKTIAAGVKGFGYVIVKFGGLAILYVERLWSGIHLAIQQREAGNKGFTAKGAMDAMREVSRKARDRFLVVPF